MGHNKGHITGHALDQMSHQIRVHPHSTKELWSTTLHNSKANVREKKKNESLSTANDCAIHDLPSG